MQNLSMNDMEAKLEAVLIGQSSAMLRLRSMIMRVARSNASVLLTGPSGSGKELVARAIHDASARTMHCFSAVNCGAIPAELIESELFGHEKGAFTGAIARRTGHFEASNGGSIFLDEIGDMRFDMQVKLLRVLEERTITRVGSSEARAVDVRIISATHQDFPTAIAEGRFREDLFFRLGVVVLNVPRLASRVEDIPALIRHFQRNMAAADKCRFDPNAIALLLEHHWPGNVRELRNLVERANTLHPGETIGRRDARFLLHPVASSAEGFEDDFSLLDDDASYDRAERSTGPARTPQPGRPIDLKREIEAIELEQIHAALDLADGIIADAARLLTLKRTTLIEKMRKYGLQQQAA
jgi:sigma-54 dependent transcriptional regulator, flagellar regulatory protein